MTLSEIHHRFFSYRNGMVAKAFADAGSPYRRVFGLQIPQLAAIARESGFDPDMARELWKEKDCRESRLLACYLFDPSTLAEDEALALCGDILTREEADILAWRLLRRLPYSRELLAKISGYVAEALQRNME